MFRVPGTCIDVDGAGVLFRGPSGAGKSDLALRLIDAGAGLVADDVVELRRDGQRLVASAPVAIAGLLEVRGFGPTAVPSVAESDLVLLVDLVPPEAIERLPAPTYATLLGLRRPVLELTPFEASAVAKVRLTARAARAGDLWSAVAIAAHSLR